MPCNDTWMIPERFCQFCIDLSRFFPVHRRGIAMVMTLSVQISLPHRIHAEYFRIFLCHPARSCRCRCSHHDRNSIFIQAVYHFFEPFQIKHAFFRLQECPGKDAEGNFIYFRFFEIRKILFQNFRIFQPLFRIVISAMQKFSKIYILSHLYQDFPNLFLNN